MTVSRLYYSLCLLLKNFYKVCNICLQMITKSMIPIELNRPFRNKRLNFLEITPIQVRKFDKSYQENCQTNKVL